MVAIANKPHYSTICADDPPRYGSEIQKNMLANRVSKLKEIEFENHRFLERLQRVSSNFSVQKWENDRRLQEQKMDKGHYGIRHHHIFKSDQIVKKNKKDTRFRTINNQSQTIYPS